MKRLIFFLFIVVSNFSFGQVEEYGIYKPDPKEPTIKTAAVTCTPTPINCDLVMNGGFEENSAIPTDQAQIYLACGWNDGRVNGVGGTADYLHTDSPDQYYSIPCVSHGYQEPTPGNINYPTNNAFAGMLIIKNQLEVVDQHYYETIHTKLKEPLSPNTTYQLSFDVSIAEGDSAFAVKMQAYLSPTLIPQIGIGDLNIPSGVGILLTNPTFSTNYSTWERITFTFTTGNTSGEQYLYLGGLSNVQFTANTPSANVPGCNHANVNLPEFALWNHTYYYFDNVALVKTNITFDLPAASISNNQILTNLHQYLSVPATTGTFSGVGVVNNGITYSFDANSAGIGTHTISFTYTYLGCEVTLYDNINVTCSNPVIIPNFDPVDPICYQSQIEVILPTTSINGISGSWSPPFVNFNATTTYIFTPDTSFCALNAELTITILPFGNPACDGICIGNIILSNPETNIDYNYKAVSTVELNTNYSITGAKNINMTAGKLIVFKPNTHIAGGSKLYAKIESCSLENSKIAFDTKIASEKISESIKEQKSEFILYPNPTNSFVTVFSQDLLISEISIISMYGTEIYRRKIENSTSYEVNVSSFSKGIYILNIQTLEGKTATRKLVIR